MSQVAKQLFDSLKNGLQGGPDIGGALNRFGTEISAEMKRMGTQGTMELASGLYSGQSNAFIQYGPKQQDPTPEHAQSAEHSHER